MENAGSGTDLPAAPEQGAPRLLASLWLLPILFLYAVLFYRASSFWGSEGYYFLSWLVPPLGAYFLWQRWRKVPIPDTSWAGGWFLGMCAGLAALLAFFLGQTMPFWRPLLFLQALLTVAAATVMTGAVGGRRWTLHFLPLFLLLLIALPWPARFEADAIYRLTRSITAMTEGALNLLGYAATSAGNRVEVQGQVVEVGDACSGLRSFQGLMMIGVVVGELYRLRWGRLILIVAAFLISFPLNAFRALTLSLIVINDGHSGYDTWHDPLGGIVYAVGCVILLGLSALLAREDFLAVRKLRLRRPGFNVTQAKAAAFAGAFLFASLLLGEAWFRLRGGEPAVAAGWSFTFEPSSDRTVRPVPLEPQVFATLGADVGSHHLVTSAGGGQVDFFDFAYDGGIMGMMAAEYHTPEVCMGKYGGLHIREKESRVWETGSRRIPVSAYTFVTDDGRELFAFQGVWLAGKDGDGATRYEEWVRRAQGVRARLETTVRRLWAGQRSFDVQVFLFAQDNASSLDEAWREGETLLNQFQTLSAL